MKRIISTAAFVLGLGAAPIAALDLGAMSDDERAAFRAEVRAYLLDNPEVLMEAIGVLEQRQAAAEAALDTDLVAANTEALFNDGYSYVGGNPDGDITLVEFLDYRCGYCKRAFAEVEELIATDGNIRFIVKEFPILGEQSTLASQFAISVQQIHGDEVYKDVHNALMSMRSDVDPVSLARLATALGLEPEPILEKMGSREVAQVIEANHLLGQRLRISGTPSFVMETEMLRGYLPLDGMRQYVDAIRAENG